MSLEIVYTIEAAGIIRRLDFATRERIRVAVERLAAHPELAKHLTGPLAGRSSYRVGPRRILFRIERSASRLLVITIGHRSNVYQRF